MEIGQICIKIAGRDAGKLCIVVDNKDKKVLVDGEVRRRWINPNHIEPTIKKAELQTGDREEIKNVFKEMGIELIDKKTKRPTERQEKRRKETKKTKRVTKPTKEKDSTQDQQQA